MATLRDIRNRIKSVLSTQKITKAMKMVAAAKLRRAQDGIINARPYANKLGIIFNHLVTDDQKVLNEYLANREVLKVLVVVVTADRGLCGSFNTNIIKEAVRLVDDELKNQGKEVFLYCVGKKGNDFFKKRNYKIFGQKISFFNKLRFDDALFISNEIIAGYLKCAYDSVFIVYNEFKSVVSQKVVVSQYLPIPLKAEGVNEKLHADYIYEKDQISIFQYILPKFLNAQMWRFLLESNASELGAKMTAMDNATTNAGELIRTLRIKYNKARQASITKEILEIVSGANALKESSS